MTLASGKFKAQHISPNPWSYLPVWAVKWLRQTESWFETHFGHYTQQKESCAASKLGNIKIYGPISQAWSPPSTASEYNLEQHYQHSGVI